jgi:hypothetical protein
VSCASAASPERYERAKLLIGKTKRKTFVDAEYFIENNGSAKPKPL